LYPYLTFGQQAGPAGPFFLSPTSTPMTHHDDLPHRIVRLEARIGGGYRAARYPEMRGELGMLLGGICGLLSARRGTALRMADGNARRDAFLRRNECEVLEGAGRVSAARARAKAARELASYEARRESGGL
jgi:hypothetical protein